MKYGVEYENINLKCANCKTVVSTDGELKKNYCEHCGAPLSAEAIAEYEERKEMCRKNMLVILKDIAVTYHTDSFLEILKNYNKESE